MAGVTYFVTLYFTSLLGTKEWLRFTCLAWRAVCFMGGVSLRVLYCVTGEVLLLSPAMHYAYTALAYLLLDVSVTNAASAELRLHN